MSAELNVLSADQIRPLNGTSIQVGPCTFMKDTKFASLVTDRFTIGSGGAEITRFAVSDTVPDSTSTLPSGHSVFIQVEQSLAAAKAYTDAAVFGTADHVYTDSKVADATAACEAYADAQDVTSGAATLASAKAYADSQDAIELAAAKAYADAHDAVTLASAKDYADAQDAALDAATLLTAKNYSDAQDAIELTAAKAYAVAQDALGLDAAKSHAVAQDALGLTAAKTYADTQDSTLNAATLASAKAYADAQDSTLDAAALASAKAYADAQDAIELTAAKAYADAQDTTLDAATLASAKSYADAQDAIELAAAKAYADAQDAIELAAAKAYADAQDSTLDAAALASAKAYTDGKVTGAIACTSVTANNVSVATSATLYNSFNAALTPISPVAWTQVARRPCIVMQPDVSTGYAVANFTMPGDWKVDTPIRVFVTVTLGNPPGTTNHVVLYREAAVAHQSGILDLINDSAQQKLTLEHDVAGFLYIDHVDLGEITFAAAGDRNAVVSLGIQRFGADALDTCDASMLVLACRIQYQVSGIGFTS